MKNSSLPIHWSFRPTPGNLNDAQPKKTLDAITFPIYTSRDQEYPVQGAWIFVESKA